MTPHEFLHLPLPAQLFVVALFAPAIWACLLVLEAVRRDIVGLAREQGSSSDKEDAATGECPHES